MKIFTWICLSQHISLKNLHVFFYRFDFVLFHHLIYFPCLPRFSKLILGGGFKCHLELSQDVSAVSLVGNCTFSQAGSSSAAFLQFWPSNPRYFMHKSVLQAVWLWSMLFTLPTAEGHLDLNGLAMHH